MSPIRSCGHQQKTCGQLNFNQISLKQNEDVKQSPSTQGGSEMKRIKICNKDGLFYEASANKKNKCTGCSVDYTTEYRDAYQAPLISCDLPCDLSRKNIVVTLSDMDLDKGYPEAWCDGQRRRLQKVDCPGGFMIGNNIEPKSVIPNSEKILEKRCLRKREKPTESIVQVPSLTDRCDEIVLYCDDYEACEDMIDVDKIDTCKEPIITNGAVIGIGEMVYCPEPPKPMDTSIKSGGTDWNELRPEPTTPREKPEPPEKRLKPKLPGEKVEKNIKGTCPMCDLNCNPCHPEPFLEELRPVPTTPREKPEPPKKGLKPKPPGEKVEKNIKGTCLICAINCNPCPSEPFLEELRPVATTPREKPPEKRLKPKPPGEKVEKNVKELRSVPTTPREKLKPPEKKIKPKPPEEKIRENIKELRPVPTTPREKPKHLETKVKPKVKVPEPPKEKIEENIKDDPKHELESTPESIPRESKVEPPIPSPKIPRPVASQKCSECTECKSLPTIPLVVHKYDPKHELELKPKPNSSEPKVEPPIPSSKIPGPVVVEPLIPVAPQKYSKCTEMKPSPITPSKCASSPCREEQHVVVCPMCSSINIEFIVKSFISSCKPQSKGKCDTRVSNLVTNIVPRSMADHLDSSAGSDKPSGSKDPEDNRPELVRTPSEFIRDIINSSKVIIEKCNLKSRQMPSLANSKYPKCPGFNCKPEKDKEPSCPCFPEGIGMKTGSLVQHFENIEQHEAVDNDFYKLYNTFEHFESDHELEKPQYVVRSTRSNEEMQTQPCVTTMLELPSDIQLTELAKSDYQTKRCYCKVKKCVCKFDCMGRKLRDKSYDTSDDEEPAITGPETNRNIRTSL